MANTESLNRLRFLENLRGHVVDNRISIIRSQFTPQFTLQFTPQFTPRFTPQSMPCGPAGR